MPIGAERVPPPREYLVTVSLVPHVPNHPVVGRVEYVVQRHGYLDHAQARREVARVGRYLVNDVLSKLAAHLWQFADIQSAKV